MIDWRGLETHAIWAVIGALLAFLWARIRAWRNSRGQSALLSGLTRTAVFVIPGHKSADRPLPVTAIEDFLAVNNIISAYLRAGKTPPKKIADQKNFSENDRRNNSFVLVGSSKRNPITKEALRLLRLEFGPLIPCFEEVDGKDQQEIHCNGAIYKSGSYAQDAEGSDHKPFEVGERTDVAVIVKAPNPWARDKDYKILIVAGVRGFGTWGAAEMLKKRWKEIYIHKVVPKNGDFVAIFHIHYRALDIQPDCQVFQVIDLPMLKRETAERGRPDPIEASRKS